MLTRLYIDNYRCFVNFEFKPARRQLILGANGSGKSSLLDALTFVRQFVGGGNSLPGNLSSQRTRWMNKPDITFEVEATLDGIPVRYLLELKAANDQRAILERSRVGTEAVFTDDKLLFQFSDGRVDLYTDDEKLKSSYEFDPHRSALATIVPGRDTEKLNRFKDWLSTLYCFRINPFGMELHAASEERAPNFNLSNVVAWYRYLLQSDPAGNASLGESLRASLDGFSFLKIATAPGDATPSLAADFSPNGASSTTYYFRELSDGQRCLISLYIILHFVLVKGATVLIDEPDNFISLREIQPWLTAVSDMIDEKKAQALLISHHPEIINQWAPSDGVQFIREIGGHVRIQPFSGDPDRCLAPAELIARGWERE